MYACLRGGTVIDTVFNSSDTLHRGAICQFFSDGFITDIVVNPPERRLAKCTSVQCLISKLSGFEGLKNWCPWHNSILCHIQIGILVNSIHMCHLLFITTKIEHQSHERKVALK